MGLGFRVCRVEGAGITGWGRGVQELGGIAVCSSILRKYRNRD